MRVAEVFAIFFVIGLCLLLAAFTLLAFFGVAATVIIIGGATLFGSGAAIIEYLTEER